jgi:BirA family biotin operon repressor/biotin-[acetyl-CoA-carboxylase] ligase
VTTFDAEAIAEGLDAPYRVAFHERIGSTNDRARELAEDGETDVAVVTGKQTAGRGRRDRSWAGPPGGVYLSLVVDPDLETGDYPLVTMAAAVATARALQDQGVEAGIKWPNDVLALDADGPEKLAGILTERVGDTVVVGIGVNANVDPGELPERATSAQSLVGALDQAALARAILDGIATRLRNPEGILPAWREDADTLGLEVRIETPGGTIEGEAVDVERPGRLVVATGDGTVEVSTGDCEHLRRLP